MNLRLVDLLREAGNSLVHSDCAVSRMEMERADAADITGHVRSRLVRQLCSFAVDHKILNEASCFEMSDDFAHDVTRFRARIYMLSPEEFEKLITRAFELGRGVGVRPGDYNTHPYLPGKYGG